MMVPEPCVEGPTVREKEMQIFTDAAISLPVTGGEGPGETFHEEAVHNGVIVLIVMEVITRAIVKRAISIYCIPNMSQVLQ